MTRRWLGIAAAVLVAGVVPGPAAAQPGRSGPYARIAVLRPRDGRTVDFEAGYIRHLEWHQRAGDPWVWYGWSVWAGERQRWFVYATFGHSIGSLDAPIAPADDEHDNILNVVPHAEFVGNALYEFVPALSRGTAIPQPTARAGADDGRPQSWCGSGVRGGARHASIDATGRDALVPDGGRGAGSAVCQTPSTSESDVGPRRTKRVCAPGRRRESGVTDDGGDSHAATDDESWPSSAGSPVMTAVSVA